MATRKKKTISKKRRKLGKRLARTLPRDAKGKFLPRGSKNLFRRKRAKKAKPTSSKKRGKKRIRGTRITRTSLMAKRRRSSTSIRSKDEFPNFIVGHTDVLPALGDTFHTQRFATPLPRLKTIGNRATVLELLWVEFFFDDLPALFNVLGNIDPVSVRWQLSMGQAPSDSTIPFGDARVIAQMEFSQFFQEDIGISPNVLFGMTTSTQPFIYNFQTRGQGFGYLLAAENFNFTTVYFNTPGLADHDMSFKLFYRFIDIPLAEFVGIVQSTQQI